jgi:hypothetical protein
MSLKSPFLIGVQETMRMRGYTIRTEKLICIGSRHSLTFTTSATLYSITKNRSKVGCSH